jgi:hypothetical protein
LDTQQSPKPAILSIQGAFKHGKTRGFQWPAAPETFEEGCRLPLTIGEALANVFQV